MEIASVAWGLMREDWIGMVACQVGWGRIV